MRLVRCRVCGSVGARYCTDPTDPQSNKQDGHAYAYDMSNFPLQLHLQIIGVCFVKKTSSIISRTRLSIVLRLTIDSVPVNEHMNTVNGHLTNTRPMLVRFEPASTSIKTTLIQRLLSWQKFATCPLGTWSHFPPLWSCPVYTRHLANAGLMLAYCLR